MKLKRAGLSPHIQGIAYSCDIPTRIVFLRAQYPIRKCGLVFSNRQYQFGNILLSIGQRQSEHCVAVQQLLLPITGITTASTADSR